MSLSGGRDLLSGALKTLQGHWDRTAPHWQDALQAVDRMDVLLQQMRRDCEGSQFDIYGSE